jgi:hypothetical protein
VRSAAATARVLASGMVLLGAAVLGCKTQGPAPSGAPDAAVAPTVAAAPTDPVAACALLMQKSVEQQRRGLEPGERLVRNEDIQRGCAAIYEDDTCRAALLRAAGPASLDATMAAFETCRAAYCPKLAAPKPSACSAPDPNAADWGELFKAVVRHDHGARGQPVIDVMEHGQVRTPVP